MKHWDLTPKQKVTLVRQDGIRLTAEFLFRDTVRCCFRVLDAEQVGSFREMQLLDDGNLADSPAREALLQMASSINGYGAPDHFATVVSRAKRWVILGEGGNAVRW